MRRGYLIALIGVIIFAVFYSYYMGFLDIVNIVSVFNSPAEKVISVKPAPILRISDVNRVLEELETFPKSETYLKELISKREESVKDPFFPLAEEEVPEEKVEVKVAPSVKAVVEVPPPMRLEGIVEAGSKKVAILQIGNEKGILLGEGESWRGVKIIKIGKKNVVVVWKNVSKLLYLPEQR